MKVTKTKRKRRCSQRRGTSLMEVIAGMTLMTLLVVPMVGLMTASGKLWKQFESGHGAVATRQSASQEIANILRSGTQVLSLNNTQVRFRSTFGDIQRVYVNRGQLMWEHAGRTDLVLENVGAVRMRRVANGSKPAEGTLIEIQVQNGTGSGVANSQSASLVWVRPAV